MSNSNASEQLKKLHYKRGSLKTKLTLSKQLLENLATNGSDIENLESNIIHEIEHRLATIIPILEEFENIQCEIEYLEENPESGQNERAYFDKEYYGLIGQFKKLLNQNVLPNRTSPQSSVSSHGSNTNQNCQSVKLPTINLPTFDGNYENWLEFRDSFLSLVHNNSNISKMQKFLYLRHSLKGEAARAIKQSQLSADTYDEAWAHICDRYTKPKLLAQNHLKALFSIEPIAKESATALRRLDDDIAKHLLALKSLNLPVNEWTHLIAFLASEKLDKFSAIKWDEYRGTLNDIPTLDDIKTFINSRSDVLEGRASRTQIELKQTKPIKTFNSYNSQKTSKAAFLATNQQVKNCIICKGDHLIYNCSEFLSMAIDSRMAKVKALKLCVNCLRSGHFVSTCKSSACKICQLKHNSLLHITKPDTNANQQTEASTSTFSATCAEVGNPQVVNQVLLSTAMVFVRDKQGKQHSCRILLDCGSQSNFISKEFCDKLNLHTTKIASLILGINEKLSHITEQCMVTFGSIYNNFQASMQCFVMPIISQAMPKISFDKSAISIPNNIKLADPNFYKARPLDMLLGAELFWGLICIGQISLGNHKPILQKTKLGWVVSGNIPVSQKMISQTMCHFSQDLENHITRFWELEEIPQVPFLSPEQESCEEHFLKTHKRDSDGRFIVTIPLKESTDKLGNSRDIALKRFYSLERKLQTKNTFRERYIEFMSEYLQLGHMSPIHEQNIDSNIQTFYFPHHGVEREESTTTKLRVVFDGSLKTDTGFSFNDIQVVGPILQSDLVSILLRFRKHKYIISADVRKMYRQVLITPEQRSLQRIFWRSSPEQRVSEYELNTVTYGTTSGSYLAIRCLVQLANEHEAEFPVASQVIRRDFYVDDLLSGANTEMEAIQLAKDISHILEQGCFKLQKWKSNHRSIVSSIVSEFQDQSAVLNIGSRENTKTLGIMWRYTNDTLAYNISTSTERKSLTKRIILSEIAQIFDPLGLLSASTILAKIILQELWQLQVSWDESVPLDIYHRWTKFRQELTTLNELQVARHILCDNPTTIELHGFADASQQAYGAAIYILSSNKSTQKCNLLCAKSKVAPLKQISIPRLELCAALILARLCEFVTKSIEIKFDHIYLWSDSTVVLSWLRLPPNTLQTFVANRVSTIQQLTNHVEWRHVPTHDNSADLLSRGVSPKSLKQSSLWWHGPSWLVENKVLWPEFTIKASDIPELRKQVPSVVLTTTVESPVIDIERFSSITKLQYILSYCLRFIHNCKNPKNRTTGSITTKELDNSMIWLVKLSQHESFPTELKNLEAKGNVNLKSKLLPLTPFLDQENIIRVGGRLHNSNYRSDKKHPIILDSSHRLTKLIFEKEHLRLLHAGPQLLLASIREKFWPISGKSLARKTTHKCIKCYRAKPNIDYPLMGNLPKDRINMAPPFYNTGTDYAGPFLLRDRRGRNFKTYKAYICLFICFVTKAIHLEIVSDLTTEAFIATFRRFTSRRGRPCNMYSDNGTTFIGARNELDQLGKFIKESQSNIIDACAKDGIQWHFIPPRAPHFGGIWEAGVKSVKFHLKRVIGTSLLVYEDFQTVLVQIESVLNSRPITPLSSDPNDLSALTPAHFLIGSSLTSIPDPQLTHIPENRLSAYQRLQLMKQHFWTRWSVEYISELQQKQKWKTQQKNIKIGTMVILKEDNVPSMNWRLGRVTQLHPGNDGIVRVVTVHTSKGDIRRALSKVCVLPVANEDIQEIEE